MADSNSLVDSFNPPCERYETSKGPLLRYEYSKLVGEDIRLVTLLPGSTQQSMYITISHTSLSLPTESSLPSTLWTKEDLQNLLPEDWKVYRNLDETFIFHNERTGKSSWTHPNSAVDPKNYRLPESYPYPGFKPKYEALSYVWGDPKDTKTIFVETSTGTRALRIGLDLGVALLHLRSKDAPRTLWIDAICINQDDQEERSGEVKRMASIYKMAYRVIAWIGPESPDSKLALFTIARLGSRMECNDDLSSYFRALILAWNRKTSTHSLQRSSGNL